ncbi:MAG: hypothetical protein GDA46_00730 [Bdellovibrionales bacterium]|nr:hypothetical protein [Bdellovibrionales bacterium]
MFFYTLFLFLISNTYLPAYSNDNFTEAGLISLRRTAPDFCCERDKQKPESAHDMSEQEATNIVKNILKPSSSTPKQKKKSSKGQR